MDEQISASNFKRNVAYKFRIGALNSGKPVFEGERMRYVEIKGKEIVRVNLVANIVEKYVQEGEKKFASLTLDDASGQIRAKVFGDDVNKFNDFNQGDTVLIVGLLRSWNNEVYISPEIIKMKDSKFLFVRKLESELAELKILDKGRVLELKEKILEMLKNGEAEGGVDIEKIILELKEPVEHINEEIKRLLEDGIAYEPRPGKLRYLG